MDRDETGASFAGYGLGSASAFSGLRVARGGIDQMRRRRTIDTTRALSHSACRRMLRTLNAERRPCSSVELAREADLSPRAVDYHLQVLQICRVTKPVEDRTTRDPVMARHQSVVSEDRWVGAQLAATKDEDEAGRPVSGPVTMKGRRFRA